MIAEPYEIGEGDMPPEAKGRTVQIRLNNTDEWLTGVVTRPKKKWVLVKPYCGLEDGYILDENDIEEWRYA